MGDVVGEEKSGTTRTKRGVLYVDGGCSGNDQKRLGDRRMVMVVTDEHGTVLSETTTPGGSNNIAELYAVRDALQWCAHEHVAFVEIRTDSRNNFAWVLGKKVGKGINDRDAVLLAKARIAWLRERVTLKLVWVGREANVAGHYIEDKYGV